MSQGSLKIIIADGNGSTCDSICSLLTGEPQYEVVGRAVNSDESLNMTFIKQPDLIILDYALTPRSALEVCEQLTLQRSTIGFVVVLNRHPDEKLFRALMEAGVSEYLVAPITKHGLMQILQQAEQKLSRRCSGATNHHHRVIAVTAPRRACGRSLLAVNLSCSIATSTPTDHCSSNTVALADLNVRSSDSCLMMDTFPRHSLINIAHGGGVDTDVLNNLLESHSSGVKLLIGGTIESFNNRELSRATILSTLATMRHRFDYTVVDAGEPGSIATETVLNLSDYILMIVAVDKIRISAARQYLDHLQEMGFDNRKLRVVANDIRPDSRSISMEEVESRLGLKVMTRVPYERQLVSESINLGTPFVLCEPEKNISRVIQNIAAELSGGRLEPRTEPGLIEQMAGLFRRNRAGFVRQDEAEQFAEAA